MEQCEYERGVFVKENFQVVRLAEGDVRCKTDHFAHLVKEPLTPPQSYMTLERNKPWAKAVSLATYPHRCFKNTMSFALAAGSCGAEGVDQHPATPPPVRPKPT